MLWHDEKIDKVEKFIEKIENLHFIKNDLKPDKKHFLKPSKKHANSTTFQRKIMNRNYICLKTFQPIGWA